MVRPANSRYVYTYLFQSGNSSNVSHLENSHLNDLEVRPGEAGHEVNKEIERILIGYAAP